MTSPLRLEAGKRYESEKGPVAGPLKSNGPGRFIAPGEGGWQTNGDPTLAGGVTEKRFGRLIREYVEEGKREEGSGPLKECPHGVPIHPDGWSRCLSCIDQDGNPISGQGPGAEAPTGTAPACPGSFTLPAYLSPCNLCGKMLDAHAKLPAQDTHAEDPIRMALRAYAEPDNWERYNQEGEHPWGLAPWDLACNALFPITGRAAPQAPAPAHVTPTVWHPSVSEDGKLTPEQCLRPDEVAELKAESSPGVVDSTDGGANG